MNQQASSAQRKAGDPERARRRLGATQIKRPVEKGTPLSQQDLGNELDRALAEALLRTRR